MRADSFDYRQLVPGSKPVTYPWTGVSAFFHKENTDNC